MDPSGLNAPETYKRGRWNLLGGSVSSQTVPHGCGLQLIRGVASYRVFGTLTFTTSKQKDAQEVTVRPWATTMAQSPAPSLQLKMTTVRRGSCISLTIG